MDINQLEALVKKGESPSLEFKSTTGQLKAALETVCALLNGKGGIVLIGVKNNGQIVGQNVTDNTRQEIAREIGKIEPKAQIEVHYISINENKSVIAVEVPAGRHAPYVYDGRAYDRNQSSTIRMSQHHYEQLLVERGQLDYSWERLIASDYDIDSLDHDEIRRTIIKAIQKTRIPPDANDDGISDILNQLDLLDNGKLTNAAVVLFAKKVLPEYPQCLIKMARFRGTTDTGEFLDNQRIHGNAFKILNEASNFITRHLPIASFFEADRFERVDKPALPVLAVREALINSICHRDYSIKASSITLAIFDNRMEIWNSGILPSQLKLDDLKKKHRSFPRNKLIAEVFFACGLIEGWGTGTTKIISICKDEDVPEPEFSEYSGGLSVTFKFKEPIGFTSRVPVGKQVLKVRQEAILSIIAERGPIGTQQLLSALSDPPSQRMLQKDLNDLRKKGLVELIGSARSSVWVIKGK